MENTTIAPPPEPATQPRSEPIIDLPVAGDGAESYTVADRQYGWNMQRVPPDHPVRERAVFVVHGIGEQVALETAATLRAGFEDALDAIEKWQQARKAGRETHATQPKGPADVAVPQEDGDDIRENVPPPFVYEGYWANYESLEETFEKDWEAFNDRERELFSQLWRRRLHGSLGTVLWFLGQQSRLIWSGAWWRGSRPAQLVGSLANFVLYLLLQVGGTATFLYLLVRQPRIVTGYLRDVRLYLEPRGIVERAIVQGIEHRVRTAFLEMLGLDENFRRGPVLQAAGAGMRFNRIVWVSHSLGTVISYNVLSDLFHRAERIAAHGNAEQKEGVDRFRGALRQFVTLGSPLDKIALLYPKRLRSWPSKARGDLLMKSGEQTPRPEWWINFHHVWDPVSGALDSPHICGDRPPVNFHARTAAFPGLAHVCYWRDTATLRYILSRVYGRALLLDRELDPLSGPALRSLALAGYVTWLGWVGALAVAAPVLLFVWIGWSSWLPDSWVQLAKAALGYL